MCLYSTLGPNPSKFECWDQARPCIFSTPLVVLEYIYLIYTCKVIYPYCFTSICLEVSHFCSLKPAPCELLLCCTIIFVIWELNCNLSPLPQCSTRVLAALCSYYEFWPNQIFQLSCWNLNFRFQKYLIFQTEKCQIKLSILIKIASEVWMIGMS